MNQKTRTKTKPILSFTCQTMWNQTDVSHTSMLHVWLTEVVCRHLEAFVCLFDGGRYLHVWLRSQLMWGGKTTHKLLGFWFKCLTQHTFGLYCLQLLINVNELFRILKCSVPAKRNLWDQEHLENSPWNGGMGTSLSWGWKLRCDGGGHSFHLLLAGV